VEQRIRTWIEAEKPESYSKTVLENIQLEKVNMQDSSIIFKMKVSPKIANAAGNLHGGAIATIVDMMTTITIVIFDKHNRAGVSVNLGVSYVTAATIGETIFVESKLLKSGKNLAFSECTIRKSDGQVVASARHTKFIESSKL